MEGVNYMDGSDIEETIFNPGEMTVEEWEELNDHRWYRESPVYSPVLNAGGVNNVNQSILENWQCAARNLRGEMDIGGKTLHEVEEAARRIRFGEVFASFNEFELCLDCWCVVNMRASHKFKRNPDCRVRICRYGLPARKKGVGKSCEWTPSEPSGSSQGLEPPHVLGVRTFNDFAARRNTPGFPTVRPDRPDLNLEEKVFSQCTQRQKKRVGVKGGCGEKDRYDAAQMMRFTHANSDGDDLDEEDIEGDEEDCDDDLKKVGHLHKWMGPTSKAPWLAQVFGDRITSEYRRPVGQLQTEFRMQYTRDVEYMQMFKMRSICQDIISGCQQQSFSHIPSLCAQISEVDPSAVVDWHRFDGTCVFMRAFVSPSACRNVLRYCQKYVALDACFTKNKKYPTQLFIATTVDGNSHVVPLAYAVAPTENYENWRWFIQNLVASIEGLESRNVIIVSDRQKGLEKAVAEVLPRNFHMHCAHHLKMNVIKHFGAAAGKAFLTLVYMDDQASYECRLVEMETRSSKGPDLVRYIRQISVDRYVRFAIPLPRYGRTTSNIVECINGALKPVRDYAPCHTIWQMWNYMLNLFYARREKARQSSEELTAFVTKRMKEIVQNCGSFVAMSAYENEALVQTDGGRKQWRLTKVPTRKCTCWEIQDCLWPCIHFVAWQKARGEDYMRYVDRIYFTKSLVQCYCKTIPVILQTELPMSVACRAPPAAIRNGRQRIVRILNGGSARSAESEFSYPIQDDLAMNPAAVMTNVSQEDGGERGNPPVPQSSAPQGEQLSQASPVTRSKGTRCCGACKQPGHTRRTCPTLRQYRRAEVQEGLDVAADG
ncbi:hypothetical protein R1sor_012735 [Riccia sorocarpa]|uniref:MULE transposase domain-containing protein n=1 Tax=Riccia sorocarpa TaxID=122646 RepID=A0ABD3IAU1_9MARC